MLDTEGTTFLERCARYDTGPLNEKDQLFLLAAAHHTDTKVPVSEIARVTGQTPNSVNRYRSRLIKAGVITEAGRGNIAFIHTAMREWIRNNQEALTP